MKATRFWSKAAFFFFLSYSLLSCAIHKNPITNTSAYPKVIERAKKDKRYFIMHSGVDTFNITSVQVEKTKRQVTVHLQKPDSLHRVALGNPEKLAGKYIRLFMRDSTSYTLDEPHTIPLDRVARIELAD